MLIRNIITSLGSKVCIRIYVYDVLGSLSLFEAMMYIILISGMEQITEMKQSHLSKACIFFKD